MEFNARINWKPGMELTASTFLNLEERLDKKAFEGARLYYHMEDYQAAHHALKNVLKDDADNQYREDILYFTAMAAYKYALNSVEEKQRERYMSFMDDYFNFVGEFDQSVYRREMDVLYKRAQRALGRAGVSDEEDTGEGDKEFEKERKLLLQESKEQK